MSAQAVRNRCRALATAISVVLLGTAMIMPFDAGASGADRAEHVRALNAQVLQLQVEARRAGPASIASSRATQALEARAAALRKLMADDPASAEKIAFPATVLESLAASFPQASASLEQRGRWSGQIEYMIEDGEDMKSHRSVITLRRGSEVLEVKFPGREPPGLRSGQKVAVSGVRSGTLVVAAETEVLEAALDGSTTTATGTATTCGPVGAQSVVTILVNLPGYKLQSGMTQDFMRGVLLGNAYAGTSQSTTDWSVNDFWQQNSDGKTFVDSASTTVVGPVDLASNFNTDANGATSCDHHGLRDAAMRAVDGQIDFRRFSRVNIVMPNNGACGWAGKATLGCTTLSTSGDGSFTASPAWLRADQLSSRKNAVMLTTHEMGHNLGLHHGASRDFGAEAVGALGAAGTVSEYGDSHSSMGYWNLGFYGASHAANQLGWLASGSGFATVESSGTYTISNYEARGGALRALKVRRGIGNSAWLWIESRQNVGIYSSTLNASLFGGALIRYEDSSTGSFSNLLDFTTATTSFSDAALPVGSTWTDPYSNVSVTVNSVTPGAMTVTVNYSGVTCTAAAPTITASPTGVATEYGASTDFNVTVKNNSSSGCAPETFTLGSTVPSGWSANFGSSAVTVGPGQQAQTVLKVGVPAPYAVGTYPVTSVAKSGVSGKSAADTENVTVVEPTNRLSISLSGSGAVSLSAPAKTCTTSCYADYAANQAATVTLTATPDSRTTFSGWSGACTGTSLTCTVAVSSDMAVTAVFGKTASTGKKRR